jgi:hypothetical protein
LTALALTVFALVVALLAAMPRGRGGVLVSFLLTICAPVVIVLGREVISNGVWALSPAECWPEEWDSSDSPSPSLGEGVRG